MERAVRVAVALLVSSALACGLLYEPDDLSRDFGVAPEEGGLPDTSSPMGETGVPPDGGGPAVDADAAPRFCAGSDATVCDDFDDPEPLGARWTAVVDAGFGELKRVNEAVVSSPNNLVVTGSHLAQADRTGPNLKKVNPSTTGHVRVSFHARIDSADPTSRFRMVDIVVGDTTVTLRAEGRRLVVTTNHPSVPESYDNPIDAGVTLSSMVSVVLDVDWVKKIVTLQVGDTIVLSVNPPPPNTLTTSEVTLGLPVIRSVPEVKVHYDNVEIN